MGSDSTILEQAMSLVDQERSYLREERCAYERFRERVRLARPDPADVTSPSETTEQLLVAYREEVMEPLDHDTVYGDTLSESLEAELSPALADLFVSKGPLTHRRKRNLLVETTVAIERRQKFFAELDEELAALEEFADELRDIESAIDSLPQFSPQEQLLEEFLEIWDIYNELIERCQRLLVSRQEQIEDAERSVRIFGDKHARNDYLYNELDTTYPVLTALAVTIERIDLNRTGRTAREDSNRSRIC